MSTARIPDGTPLGLVQVGLAIQPVQSNLGIRRFVDICSRGVRIGPANHRVKPRYRNTGSKTPSRAVRPESWRTAHA